MGIPVDLDALTKATRKREFEDGLMDYLNGAVFLVLGLLAWFFFSPAGLTWYAMAVINYRTITIVGLLCLYGLVITGLLLLRRLIDHIRISVIWKNSGFIKPLHRQTNWPVTLL